MKVLKQSGTGKRRTGSTKPEPKAAGEQETVQTRRKGKAKRGKAWSRSGANSSVRQKDARTRMEKTEGTGEIL